MRAHITSADRSTPSFSYGPVFFLVVWSLRMRCRNAEGAISRRSATGQQSRKKDYPVQRSLMRNAADALTVMKMLHANVISELDDLARRKQDGSQAKTTPPRSRSSEAFQTSSAPFLCLGLESVP